MITLRNLMCMDCFQLDVEAGFIRLQNHPTEDYVIANYTEKAVYQRYWSECTRQCRGLIFHRETFEVIARPFEKFFNYGEHQNDLDVCSPVEVTDKLDGSMLSLYRLSSGAVAGAVRGSFVRTQAIHATVLWHEKYGDVQVPEDLTPIFEVIYPENRVVLDYGDLNDLVYLGAVEISTGRTFGPNDSFLEYPGPRAEVFEYATLKDALAAKPRDNAEGLVVRYLDSGMRLKIKQDDYVALHKIVTGLSTKTVWEAMLTQTSLEDLCAPLPDELHPWVKEVHKDISMAATEFVRHIYAQYMQIQQDILAEDFTTRSPSERLDPKASRKRFADRAKSSPVAPYLFRLYDGATYEDIFMHALSKSKPTREVPYHSSSEDTA